MLKRKLILLMIFLWIFLILGACNVNLGQPHLINGANDPSYTMESSREPSLTDNEPHYSISTDGCISPVENFAYSIDPRPSQPVYPGNGLTVLPSSPWQADIPLTEVMDTSRYSTILTTRFFNNQIEIWIWGYPLVEPGNEDNYEFIVYRPDTKTWVNVSAEIEDSGIYVDKLFVTQEGTMWGQTSRNEHNNTSIISVLSKYNDKLKRFEFERGAQKIPATWTYADGFVTSSKVLLDKQRTIFWILVPEDAIYSYNPITQEAKYHVELPDMDISDLVADPVLSSNGGIYYLTYEPNVFTNENIRLYYFTPETNELEKLAVQLEPWPVASTIFADQSGRLWFGGIGWRDANGKWYQILRSPVFVTNTIWSGMDYRWKSPDILIESSDNRLWFRSDNGLVWLDPAKGEWCWFTTEQSNVVEDEQHNLWMIADKKLYKYPLNP